MTRTTISIIALLGLALILAIVVWDRNAFLVSAWERTASPGPLSDEHAFLSGDCGACHTPVAGVGDTTCVFCHANETVLVQRQPTAFHAAIADSNHCVACHQEHDAGRGLTRMDHAALADMLMKRTHQAAGNELDFDFTTGLKQTGAEASTRQFTLANGTTHKELSLDCSSCHGTSDPHVQVFGHDCVTCHGTSSWSIIDFQHPSASSTDCGQCHLAPPSHYMEHFQMVSQPVAEIENAKPEQCYLCHQTTSWNDIRRLGIYDHH